MSERLETLKKARARMIEERDVHAKVLAAPFDRDKAERARNKFIEIQMLVDALDRAISGEEVILPKAEPHGSEAQHQLMNGYSGAKRAQLHNASLQIAPNELPGSSPGSHGRR